jgi:outer membrane protein assembly factor BamB
MKTLKSKAMAILISMFFIISMGASMILLPNANATSKYPTFSFISVSPNPVGVGQTLRVNFWVNQPPPTASAQYGDRWTNMTVVVTKPDGTKQTLGPFTSDDTGGTHTDYVPTTVGNYSFQFFFGGYTIQDLNPATPYPPGVHSAFYGDYFEPSQSNVFTVTVQQAPIASAPVTPLPTNYWTRPIYAQNTNWYTIAGPWLGLGQSSFANTGMFNYTGNYNPWTTAPTTGHILWTKPEAWGGVIGGQYGGSETSNYYSTSQYEPKFAPIVMQGVLYYTTYPGASTYPEGWVALDLHTGQVIWTKTEAEVGNEVLRCGQILNEITPNQYGAESFLWATPAVGFMGSPTYMSMYDAMTGNWILNITNGGIPAAYPGEPQSAISLPMMTLTSDNFGDLIGYFINSTTNFATGVITATLCMWNSTADINLNSANYGGGNPVANQWMWRPPQGGQIPFVTTVKETNGALESSVTTIGTLPGKDTSAGSSSAAGAPGSMTQIESFMGMTFSGYLLGISSISSGVVLLTGTLSGAFAYNPGWNEECGFSLATGQVLWGPTNRTEVQNSIIYSGSGSTGGWVGDGAYVEYTDSTLTITGYSLTTGNVLWGPEPLPGVNPFSSLGANAVNDYNGTIYIWTYGGDVYAVNILTGAILWHYHTPPGGYESPYGNEPLWTFSVGTLAGGELFVPEGHMYSPPLFHNAQQLAINVTNGQVVWQELAFDVTSAPAVADGVATTLNAYDNQIYAWGMGPSKTTVSAPDVGVTTATPITITGTVMDISAGSQQEAVAANFPNGLPCVSDASMSQFMEAVYMQQPMPTNITGVPVTLSVLDSNGNHYNIGTVTTDASGTYSLTWTPIIPGDFTVYATFAGTQAYYGSSAEAHFYASAPAPTASPAPVGAVPPTGMYVAEAAVAIIVVVIVCVVVLAMLMLRKRP